MPLGPWLPGAIRGRVKSLDSMPRIPSSTVTSDGSRIGWNVLCRQWKIRKKNERPENHAPNTHTHTHTNTQNTGNEANTRQLQATLRPWTNQRAKFQYCQKVYCLIPLDFPGTENMSVRAYRPLQVSLFNFFLVEAMKNQTLRANKIEKIENNVSLSLWGMDFKICFCLACPFSFPYACLVTRSLVQNESVTSVEFAAQSLRCCLWTQYTATYGWSWSWRYGGRTGCGRSPGSVWLGPAWIGHWACM